MSLPLNEDIYYVYASQAMNDPNGFIASLPSFRQSRSIPSDYLQLSTFKAYMVLAQYDKAEDILNKISPNSGPFCQCLLNMGKYSLSVSSPGIQDDAAGFLKLAEKYEKMCNNPALTSNLIILQCLKNATERELTMSEDLLQEAMKSALSCNLTELQLDIYLVYAQLYLMNNLPDAAQRELLMLEAILEPERYPLNHSYLLNLIGITYNIAGKFSSAAEVLEKAMNVSRTHGYVAQQAQIYSNLGIALTRQNRIDEGIAMYDNCLQLLSGNVSRHPVMREKAWDNKALALAIKGDLEEAIRLKRNALADAIASGNLSRKNNLYVNLADTLIEIEEFAEAEEYLDSAIGYFSKTRQYNLLQNALLCKARFYEVKGDYAQAFGCMEELYQASRKYFQENFSNQANKYMKRIEDIRNEYFIVKSQCSSLDHASSPQSEMIGEHPDVKKAIANALQAAKYPFVHVLVSGESGTGKEIIAKIVHAASQTNKPMVAINASAIPQNLIESELFGHIRGAFTGAVSDHKGKFALAANGILFLDEISDMPLDCQAKLLRAIEQGVITPVGSDKEIPVKCRIISATNRKMADLIRENQFRLDLYHRLNKVEIHLPPLRERMSDLELLTTHFVSRFAGEFRQPVPRIDAGFYDRLRQYRFPGNIRELMNIIERIFILKPKLHWSADQLDGLVQEQIPAKPANSSVAEHLNDAEYQVIRNALQQANWVQKDAAVLLGMTPSTLCRHIRKLGITRQ